MLDKLRLQLKQEPVEEHTKEYLVQRKEAIEKQIRQFEKIDLHKEVVHGLQQLSDISVAVGEIQEALNIVWKRTEQLQEHLKNLKERTEQ